MYTYLCHPQGNAFLNGQKEYPEKHFKMKDVFINNYSKHQTCKTHFTWNANI